MSVENRAPFEVDGDEYIVIGLNDMIVIVPYLGGTYISDKHNTVESSFCVAP